MEGVSIDVDDDATTLVLEEVSDDLKQYVRERLAAFCFGAVEVEEDRDYYSFKRTIEEFLKRLDAKPKTTRLGMVGELVVHVLMPSAHPLLTSTAVFFNKEERSIKKGFDLTFHESTTSTVWYGEVKSGEASEGQAADEKTDALLLTAASDIAGKLSRDVQRSRWDSAILDAALTLESSRARTVKALLRSDAKQFGGGETAKKRVVLAAALIHALDHCRVSSVGTRSTVEKIARSERFDALRVIVVQQSELDAIVDFLRSEI